MVLYGDSRNSTLLGVLGLYTNEHHKPDVSPELCDLLYVDDVMFLPQQYPLCHLARGAGFRVLAGGHLTAGWPL